MATSRAEIVPPEVELFDGLPELYREMVGTLAATLLEEAVAPSPSVCLLTPNTIGALARSLLPDPH